LDVVVEEEQVALTIEEEAGVVEVGEGVALRIAAEDGPFPREEAFNKKGVGEAFNRKEEAFTKKEEAFNKKEGAFNNRKEEDINKNQEVAEDVPFIVDEGVFRTATLLRQQAEVVVGITKGEDEDVADFVEEGGINGLAPHQ
jgi:hypothetical protein